jgi:hypothetical protein
LKSRGTGGLLIGKQLPLGEHRMTEDLDLVFVYIMLIVLAMATEWNKETKLT